MKTRNMFHNLLLATWSLVFGATQAHAVTVVNYIVLDNTTSTATATTYSFTIVAGSNTNNAFQSLLIPYFSDAAISNITVPTGWTYVISPTDVFGLGSETLEFMPTSTLIGLTYGTQITGISFTSIYGTVNGPIGNSQSVYGTFISDPPIPGSPDTIKALNAASAPEPSTSALTVAAILVVVGFGAQRKRKVAA